MILVAKTRGSVTISRVSVEQLFGSKSIRLNAPRHSGIGIRRDF
jgi:hypothetical protein